MARRKRDPLNPLLIDALHDGDLTAVRALVEHGADPLYVKSHQFDAPLDAVHGRSIQRDPGLIELLEYLIAQGVELSRVSTYGEAAVRVLSRVGRFDAVRLLLDAGADEGLLEWTPLHRAAALGSVEEVLDIATSGSDLESRDTWLRTPYLVALTAGSVDKAKALLDAGASPHVTARCAQPALFMPVISGRAETLSWLLEQPFTRVDQADEFGRTALTEAVGYDEPECVDLLIEAGADVNHETDSGTVMSQAESRPVVMRLLDAGADPAEANQRLILGLGEPDPGPLRAVSKQDFRREAKRVFGRANPERMDRPFWEAMIRAGVNTYQAGQRFGVDTYGFDGPVWCAERFRQSLTLLPDGRAVQIGGEHEDHYDPDFCIYNDIFVHDTDGRISIFGYPEGVFPPTDFHTATLLGDCILIVGRLGYAGQRLFGNTPVFRLTLNDWRIAPVQTTGETPGWMYEHRAERMDGRSLRVWGGKVAV